MNLAMIGAIMCGFSVGLGAFGAHAVSTMLDVRAQDWWQTATEYLWYHGLGLLALWSVGQHHPIYSTVTRFLLPGTLIFSGSLYVYAFTGWRLLGMITPIGGTLLLLGWIKLAFALRKNALARDN